MKIFLMTFVDSNYTGINSKILSQRNALINLGHECMVGFFAYPSDGSIIYEIDGETILRYNNKLFKIERYVNLSSILRWIEDNGIQLVYFRYAICANPYLINFFKELKTKGIKIITEIPTFPYDKEITKNSFLSYSYYMHKCFRKSILRCSDTILTFSDNKEIYGLPATIIDNAMNSNDCPLKKDIPLGGEFHLIGVANISYWHGFDRIVRSIQEYNNRFNDYKIIFHIVGGDCDSQDYKDLVSLVKECGVTDNVIFHGVKTGEELTQLFDLSHMAVGSLGRHRSGINVLKALKNNEYACRGIPFMYSEINPLYDQEDYVYKVKPDESTIHLDDVIQFYKGLNSNPIDIHENFMTKNLTWEHQFRKIGL